MNIKFSPPDISESEINEVVDALKSGWITTGPKTALSPKDISMGITILLPVIACTSQL